MSDNFRFSRRYFLLRSGTAFIGLAAGARLGMLPESLRADESSAAGPDFLNGIIDPEVRAGLDAAINKNLIPAATEQAYPGHFNISADGVAYGGNTTWPGLDSWQMAGAYLLLGRTRLVLDYFDFVQASQRGDGNIPFAIFPGETRPDKTYLSGMKYPEDLFTYKPPKRDGFAAYSQETHDWMRLFVHWQPKANPLSTLGPICYILTAAEIFDTTKSLSWLKGKLPSLESAAEYLLSRKSKNGLISGSGFYMELPPRYEWDGINECYAIHAFRELARLYRATGETAKETTWSGNGDTLVRDFKSIFWQKDHFAEYVHPEHGLVDSHGLSDVNWAAVAFGIADKDQTEKLWPLLMKEPGFWYADMPTQLVTKPFTYEKWEYNESVPFTVPPLQDVAAMGRVWFVEATACTRMGEHKRLIESVRKVWRAAKTEGYWRERYHPHPDGTVTADGAQKYCEYAAVLTRIVLGNREIFFK